MVHKKIWGDAKMIFIYFCSVICIWAICDPPTLLSPLYLLVFFCACIPLTFTFSVFPPLLSFSLPSPPSLCTCLHHWALTDPAGYSFFHMRCLDMVIPLYLTQKHAHAHEHSSYSLVILSKRRHTLPPARQSSAPVPSLNTIMFSNRKTVKYGEDKRLREW